jgi:hypothetical protein
MGAARVNMLNLRFSYTGLLMALLVGLAGALSLMHTAGTYIGPYSGLGLPAPSATVGPGLSYAD